MNSQILFPMLGHLRIFKWSSEATGRFWHYFLSSLLIQKTKTSLFKSLWHSIAYLHFWPLLSHPKHVIDWPVIILHLVYLNFWQYVIFLSISPPHSLPHIHKHTHTHNFSLGNVIITISIISILTQSTPKCKPQSWCLSASVTLY